MAERSYFRACLLCAYEQELGPEPPADSTPQSCVRCGAATAVFRRGGRRARPSSEPILGELTPPVLIGETKAM